MAGFCENGNDPSGSLKQAVFEKLSECVSCLSSSLLSCDTVQQVQCHNPEDRDLNVHRRENQKSRVFCVCFIL
jgi:hypothetical protein